MASWLPDNSPIPDDGLPDKIAKALNGMDKTGVFKFPPLKEAEDEIPIIEKKGNTWRTTNYMGWFSSTETMLTIGSRFDEQPEDNKPKDYFLLHMLSTVLGLNISSQSLPTEESTLSDMLLDLVFLRTLADAVQKGVIRMYVRRNYNDSNIRGALDVPQHIKLNTPFVGKVAYSTREYDTDNPVTELIRHAIEQLDPAHFHSMTQDDGVRRAIASIWESTQHYWLADRQHLIEYNRRHPVTHPYYSEYRLLQQLSLALLTHQSFSPNGRRNDLRGVVFDGAWLWEQYLATLLKDRFDHPDNVTGKDTQYLFVNQENEAPFPECYPDLIGKESPVAVVADAKYKSKEKTPATDFYQILSYVFRFQANCGLLLYPRTTEGTGQTAKETYCLAEGMSPIEGRPDADTPEFKAREDGPRVIKIALDIPKSSKYKSFDEYQNEISKREKEFTDRVEEAIQLSS